MLMISDDDTGLVGRRRKRTLMMKVVVVVLVKSKRVVGINVVNAGESVWEPLSVIICIINGATAVGDNDVK